MTPELIQPGLWRIPLKMRSLPPFVNVYLVRSLRGWLLIDTGPPAPAALEGLLEAFSTCGVELRAIEHILLTHLHPDHTGQALALRELTGAPVWLHPADARLLDEILAGRYSELDGLDTLGTPPALQEEIKEFQARLMSHFPPLTADRALEDGTRLETALGPLRVILTPGHSPGHCCLFLESARLLFSGDHVLPDVLPHSGFIPGHDSLGEYLATFPTLRELDVRLILPSHGLPFDRWRPWLDRAEATHQRRLERVAQLKSQGLSVHEIVLKLWPRELKPMDYQLALTRVLGYLRHLDSANLR